MLTSVRESRTCFYGTRKYHFMYDILLHCTTKIVGTDHIQGLEKKGKISSHFGGFIIIMCVSILPTCICLHHMYVWSLQRPKEDIGSPELEIEQVVNCHTVASNQTLVF